MSSANDNFDKEFEYLYGLAEKAEGVQLTGVVRLLMDEFGHDMGTATFILKQWTVDVHSTPLRRDRD